MPQCEVELEIELGAVLEVGDVQLLHRGRGALAQDAANEGREVEGAGVWHPETPKFATGTYRST